MTLNIAATMTSLGTLGVSLNRSGFHPRGKCQTFAHGRDFRMTYLEMIWEDLRAVEMLNAPYFDNAVAVLMARGVLTNGIIHLMARNEQEIAGASSKAR